MGEQIKEGRLTDAMKWLLIIVIVLCGVIGNVYYASLSPALRLVAGIILCLIAVFIAVQTKKGKKTWQYLKEAKNEIRRVVWPTRQAVVQIALVVVAMVTIASVTIFIFDQIFVWLIAWLTGQRG